jgi:hypothetical protein
MNTNSVYWFVHTSYLVTEYANIPGSPRPVLCFVSVEHDCRLFSVPSLRVGRVYFSDIWMNAHILVDEMFNEE